MNTEIRKEAFNVRFASHQDELKWLYMELYHNDGQAWEQFAGMLYRLWESRPETLKQLDLEREADPDWYRRRLTGMQMSVKDFAGTIQGLRKKLDYVQRCGVNCLCLMPVLESPADRSDEGRAVSDFRKVQPELGTMEELAALAEDCRRKGISLCLDFMMNHTSENHEWARRARAGDRTCQSRYFFYDSWDIPNWYEQTVPQALPDEAPGSFTWCGEAGKVVMTMFHPYEWDLNYANPAVFTDMTDNLLNLCNHGADMIRLDGVSCIWKAPGTCCRNLPQVHSLIRMIRIACEIVCPGTLLIGDAAAPGQAVFFGPAEKPECHMLLNTAAAEAIWHTVATRNVRLLAHQLGQEFAMPKQNVFLNYLRGHDEIRWRLDYDYLYRNFGWQEGPHKRYLNDYLTGAFPGSPARGERYNSDPESGDERLCGTTASLCGVESAREGGGERAMAEAVRLDGMLHALVFTLSGVPVLCSGDEIALENNEASRKDPTGAKDNQRLYRGRMDWEKAKNRSRKDTPEGAVFDQIRRLEKLRAKYGAFDPEADIWILDTGSDYVLGIGRYYRGEKLLALFNFSRDPQTARIHEEAAYRDLTGDGRSRRINSLTVEAGGYRWLYRKMQDDAQP